MLRLVPFALLVLLPIAGFAQGPMPDRISGTDLGSGRVVALTGTDLGSGRLVDRFRVTEAQMERLLADRRFSVAVRRAGEIHVEAAEGYTLHAAESREGVADCSTWTAACHIRRERATDTVLIVSPVLD